MTGLLSFIGAIVILCGSLFLALGGLGLYRMPDTWTRIQSGTKATTLGTLLTLIGAAIIVPAWAIKLLLLMLFVMFTNPLSSQVLARAVHRSGARPVAKADALAAAEEDAA